MLGIYIFLILGVFSFGLNTIHHRKLNAFPVSLSKESTSSGSKLDGPPIIDSHNDDRGRGGENGIKQVDKETCLTMSRKWMASLGIASTSSQLEFLESYLLLEKFSKAMPGSKPARNEFIAFGKFENGKVEGIVALYWKKIIFPQELELVTLALPKRSSQEAMRILVEFILELCRDNMMIPNLQALGTYSSSLQTAPYERFIHPSANAVSSKSSKQQEKIVSLYSESNKSPVVCIDQLKGDIGCFWYCTTLYHPNRPHDFSVTIYFRKKAFRDQEYEVSFMYPGKGTEKGSCTVSGSLIVDLDEISGGEIGTVKFDTPTLSKEQTVVAKLVAMALKERIHHPTLES